MSDNFYTNVCQVGSNILVRGFENGKRVSKKAFYKPYLFVNSNKDSHYKDIFGNKVSRIDFSDIKDCRNFMDSYKDTVGMEIYGLDRWRYVYIYDNYKDMRLNLDLINTVALDIEVASDDGFPDPKSANKEIIAITLRRRNLKIVLGCGDFVSTDDKNTYYMKCKDEKDLLFKFLSAWKNLDIDVITGWNIEFFDIPYLVNRIRQILPAESEKKLSPWGVIKEYNLERNEDVSQGYSLVGISMLDYMRVYKKFNFEPRESYTLNYICQAEVGAKKIDYSEYGDLHSLYKTNFQKFIEYNIRDVDLIFMLEEKLGFLDQIFTIAYDAKVNHEDALASVLIWDVIIHNYLMDKNIVVSNKKEVTFNKTIEGGFVKHPIVGMHEWVVSFDLNSLYPHLIQQYNIGPDTHIKNFDVNLLEIKNRTNVYNLLSKKIDTSALKKHNCTVTPNGQFYSREKQSFLSSLMKQMYDDRIFYKNKMVEAKKKYEKEKTRELEIEISRCYNLQIAKKIQLNSAYGALANQYFRWFDLENAEAITMAGQLSIRFIEKKINDYLNKVLKTNEDYIIAVDTDSVYITFEKFINKVFKDKSDKNKIINFLNDICDGKLQDYISESYHELAEYVNAYEQRMNMKRENIAEKGIWTAKKRYILNVWDSEGVRYKEPKLKIMGIEAIRSSTPTACRKYIKEGLNIIMNKDEKAVQDYIANAKVTFKSLKFEDIAFPRSVNFMTWKKAPNGGRYEDTYIDRQNVYKKGAPIQVKGALLFNNYLKKLGLTKKYEEIKNGEKIKFCYLVRHNPIMDTVIASKDSLPLEFKLDKYIDYDLQFEKGFLSPIENILNSIGWRSEKKATVEDFF